MPAGYIVVDWDGNMPVTAQLEGEPPIAVKGSNVKDYADAIAEEFPDDV